MLTKLEQDPVKVIRSILVICRVSYFLAWPLGKRYSKILVSHAVFFIFVTKMLYFVSATKLLYFAFLHNADLR